MEKLQWFKFSPMDWTMGKISRLPFQTQGLYVRLCCVYWNKECIMTEAEALFEMGEEPFNILVSANIIKVDESGCICIDFLDQQMNEILETAKRNKLAGIKSGIVRRNKSNTRSTKTNDRSTTVQRNRTTLERNRTDKDIDKEKDIYRCFDNLSISVDEYNKLVEIWDASVVNSVLDSIENYKQNHKYKSLYLTARSWLGDKPKKNESESGDNLVSNVMKQIK